MGTELTYLNAEHDKNLLLNSISIEVQQVVEKPFVLFVSTIEIRKNHIYIFQIWQQLIQQYDTDTIPNLILVGHRGWMVDTLFTQLDNTKYLDGKILILHDISDIDLKVLYENCLFTVYPSVYEGFGLPVAESLNYGKVCVASNVTSIPEAGGDLAIYIDPYNLNSGYQAIEELLFNPTTLKERESLIRNTYRPVSWKMATESLIDSIQHILASISDVPTIQEPAIANLLPVPVAKLNKKYWFSKKLNYSQNEQYANNAFCSQVLQKKWHQVEEYHIWSEGKTALLAFALPKPEISDILICYIEFNLPNYFDKQQVTVKLNQQHFSTWTIPPGQIIHKILKFNTAQAFAISNDNVVFTLHIELDHITTPNEKNIQDTRILGIGMRSLTLIDGTDLLQRIQVLENLLEIRTI